MTKQGGKKKPAVFLDRDGTITEEVGYVNHESRVRVLPRSAEAIKLLNDHGVLAVIVTNQSGVARGYFDEALVGRVHQRLISLLKEKGAVLDGIYYCPHHPSIGLPPYRQVCKCRKPDTGLLERAAAEMSIDLSRSYVVGDRVKDIEFGKRMNLKSVFVLTGYGKGEYEYQHDRWTVEPDHVAEDLLDAVKWILENMGTSY